MLTMNEEVEFLVTDIKELSGRRRLVFVNYEPAFALYSSEIRKYAIQKDTIISTEVYQQLLTEVFDKRATARAMNLLQAKDYSKKELTDKLVKDYYPETAIQRALEYVEKFGYINDYRYAETYVQFKSTSKSRKQIVLFLQKKGIAQDIIEHVCDAYYDQNQDVELDMILTQMRKKAATMQEFSYENKMKLMGCFYRKGFQTDTIKKALDIVVQERDNS